MMKKSFHMEKYIKEGIEKLIQEYVELDNKYNRAVVNCNEIEIEELEISLNGLRMTLINYFVATNGYNIKEVNGISQWYKE